MSKKLSLGAFLIGRGFNKVFASPEPSALAIVKVDKETVNPILLMDADVEEKRRLKEFKILESFERKFSSMLEKPEDEMLSIIMGSHSNEALEYCKTKNNCWYVDKLDQKIYIYDHQKGDFCNIRRAMESWIEENGVIFPKEILKDYVKPQCIPAIVISAICTLVTVLFYLGILNPVDFFLYKECLTDTSQWYRFFSATIAHIEISHLMMNMLMLNVIAVYAEHYYGKVRLIIGYLLSGLAGGIASMCYAEYMGNDYLSLGASGAIYGLIGMVMFYLLYNWRKFSKSFFRRLMLAVIVTIVGAFYSTHVDHLAHIGGFLCGYLVGAVMTGIAYIKRNTSKKRAINK